MQPARILIVDDEPGVRYVVEHSLRKDDYCIDQAENGAQAIEKVAATRYDLLMLDLKMEPVGGIEVLGFARRQDEDLPVIILTAHGTVESAVEALRLGAFDYLFKPATPDDIRQRVRAGLQFRRQAVQRRQILSQIDALRQTLANLDVNKEEVAPPPSEQRFLRQKQLVIDRHHRVATLGGRLLDLTSTEFDLLLCLVKAAPEPVAAREIIRQVLRYEVDEREGRDLAKWHIHQLRRKVEVDPARPEFIKTVRYQGYLWSGG